MENPTLIAVFTLPQDAYIIQAKLDEAGISSTLKDELTVQVHNFLSNAIGGVKLFTDQKDAENAKQIVRESGHAVDDPVEPNSIERATYKIVNKLSRKKTDESGVIAPKKISSTGWWRILIVVLIIIIVLALLL